MATNAEWSFLNTIPTISPGLNRIFIGIPCDHQTQRQINEFLVSQRKPALDIRWVMEKNRHLTLAFLGNLSIARIDNLLGLFDETYQNEAGFKYLLTRLTRFPDPTGRIIALINKPDRSLGHLFQVTLRLLHSIKLEPDRKEFRPHITLGRIRRAKQVKTKFDQQTNIVLDISRIRLYQSTMTESGSIYTPLKETQLRQ